MRIVKRVSALILASVLTLSAVLCAWSMAETEEEAVARQYPEVIAAPPTTQLSPWSMLAVSHNLASIKQKKLVQRIRKAAQDRMDLALEEAQASFESEKEQALVDAAAAAKAEMTQALEEAAYIAETEMEQALAEAAEYAQSEKEQALAEAAAAAKDEMTQALAEAAATAETELEQALADAAAVAESEKAQALADAAAVAESEKAQALADAAAAAESEKTQALADAAAAAETEMEQALADAAATAETEMEQALADAAAVAESEKAQALADAAAVAESEKTQALSDAAAAAESEKEQALSDAAAAAESEKAQALTDAQAQWDADLKAQEEAEQEALYNSNVWTAQPVQIRESADPDSTVLVIADAGAPVTVLAQEEDSFLIDYYGVQGYADRSSLTIPEAMEEQVASAPGVQSWCSVTLENAATHLNVREGPGTEHKIIDRLDSEEVVYMTGNCSEDGRWAEILYDNGGSCGWASTNYLTVRSEGEPEELTRLMYYAQYDQIADILRNEDVPEPAAWKNGNEVNPQTVVGNATILSDDCVYTGAVVAGEKMGYGTLLMLAPEEGCYIRITGTWKGDTLNGMTVWSFYDPQDPSRDITISGKTENSLWQKDVIFQAQGKEGKQKYFYGYADHGEFSVKQTAGDGTAALGRSSDGEFLFLDPEETRDLLKNL